MEEKKRENTKKRIAMIVIAVVIGFFIGYIFPYANTKTLPEGKETSLITRELTNPAINYECGQTITENKEINLEKPLQEFIQEKKYSNETNHVSVYYRNLNNGNWFGINEKEMFSPASLMKLPLLLVYLKKIEADPKVWDKELIYIESPEEREFKQNVVPKEQLINKETYTIRELLNYMIEYSDNRASVLLEQNIQLEDYKRAFTDNSMIFPEFIDGRFDNNLKVLEYARFFRVLFNASYVNKELSNYALRLLTKVDFTKGLVAGVDTNTIVAHKFGERGIIGQDGIERKQLHDCGIIYYPNHPYLLCIMTRGDKLEDLENIIREISKNIYQEVQKKNTTE